MLLQSAQGSDNLVQSFHESFHESFQGRPKVHEGCMHLMRFLTRSLDLESDKNQSAEPGFCLAFEAFIENLEVVAILAILGLSVTAFLPQLYVEIQVAAPS